MIFEKNDQITPGPRKKTKQLSMIISIVILLCIVGVIANFTVFKHSTAPFPANITTGLNYQVYYSVNNTSGYSYQPGSAKIQTGILFFTMKKNDSKKRIFITEQAAPSAAVNLASLPKHSSLDVPIGKAVIGTGLGNPSIVIMTSSTLIQLTSSKGVTKADIIDVAQKMTLQNYSQ